METPQQNSSQSTSLNNSPNTQQRLAALRRILPEAFAEGKVDWEKLKATLGEHVHASNERYTLNWAGKSEAIRAIQTPSTRTLMPDKAESLHFDDTKNIFIEGENLEVLKVLQKSYSETVKMIYIDPPYNTGKDLFIYPDTFAEHKATYQQRVGDRDEAGYMTQDGMFRKNSKENGQYHSNWLSMMYPRLFLARTLLRDDGVIFVSIDDNEVHNLRLLMDEIFGEENFVAEMVWNTKKGAQGMTTKTMIVPNHEYILVYSKQIEQFRFLGIMRDTTGFSNPDNDPRGLWKRQYLQRLGQGLHTRTIVDPVTAQAYSFETPYTQEKLARWVQEGRILFPKHQSGYPARKEFLNEYEHQQQLVTSLGVFPTKATTEKLYNLFDGVKIFTNPKPDTLIAFLIEATTNKHDIILDFFAGSGTTAHAVMDMNQKDGGNRTYICVQLPEPCDEKSEAYKAGYCTIADIAKARIRRAAHTCLLQASRQAEAGVQQTIEHELTLPSSSNDTGVKVMKLTESNFKQWHPIPNSDDTIDTNTLEMQLEQSVHSIADYATAETMVYELLLKNGKNLNSTLTYHAHCHYINENELVLLLETVTPEIVDSVLYAYPRPQKVIALDSLFNGNDQLKANITLQMRDMGILFTTV